MRSFTAWSAALSLGLTCSALVGWLGGRPELAALGTSTVPMAPNTALAFIATAGALLLRARGHVLLARVAVSGVALLAVFTVLERALSLGLEVDRWLMSTDATLRGVPLGVMSTYTALAFAPLSVALILPWERRTSRQAASTLATASAMLGAVFLLGYAYRAPLFEGTAEIPMAISTASAFVLLALGVIAVTGADTWPLRPLIAHSVEGLLLRAFAPVLLAAVVAEGLLISTVLRSFPLGNPAIVAATVGVGSSLVLGLAATRIAARVARSIERAERAAAEARDALVEEVVSRARAEASLERARSELLHAQKLQPLAQLAGGVAHDFNNLLSVMLGQSELLATDERLPDGVREVAREIRHAADIATSLTRQLLAFARRQPMQRSALDLNALIAENAGLIRHLAGRDVELETSLGGAGGIVLADRGQVEQVLMNLTVNAGQAMPKGGKLRISTALVDPRAAGVDGELPPGTRQCVLLSVSDTGTGMDATTLARLFEPFFTTKEGARGTGLGLATVHGIVHQSDGCIRVTSTLGRGSRFDIYLPRSASKPLAPAETPERTPVRGRGERVLVVDDDAMVRRSTRRILERRGFVVLEAASGAEALREVERAEDIDVVVTDLVMPAMSGPDLARELRKARPRLRLLFISGYAADTAAEREELDGGAAFLQKPFTPDALTAKLRELLTSAPASLARS
ncbi:MAG: response regulator [Polyangiaceae bacterium]|nr:response regulator [Polyangiaceae bacterium]